MELIITYFSALWRMTELMAPYLLIGFTIAGLLKIWLNDAFIQKHLSADGIGGVVRASLLGVPLPLCSCGVLPVAVALRQQGASKGATASFLASTPQTGVDSILATQAMMGPVFAVFRVIVAFMSGFFCGLFVDKFSANKEKKAKPCCEKEEKDTPKEQISCCSAPVQQQQQQQQACCGGSKPEPEKEQSYYSDKEKKPSYCTPKEETKSCCGATPTTNRLATMFQYGFVTLPNDIRFSIFIGLGVAALLSAFVPTDSLAPYFHNTFLSFLAVTLLAIPLYTCSTGSIPVAFALMAAGLSPGAALVYLAAGPGTSMASVATLWKLVGPQGTGIFLLTLIAVSWIVGAVLNTSGLFNLSTQTAHMHPEHGSHWWETASAIALIAMIAHASFKKRKIV